MYIFFCSQILLQSMTALAPHVETWAASGEKLACTLKRFREQGAAAGPLTFGAHRKSEGGGLGVALASEAAHPETMPTSLAKHRLNQT